MTEGPTKRSRPYADRPILGMDRWIPSPDLQRLVVAYFDETALDYTIPLAMGEKRDATQDWLFIEDCIEKGYLRLVQWYYRSVLGAPARVSHRWTRLALLHGRLAVVEWLYEQGLFASKPHYYEHAIESGCIPLLDWLVAHNLAYDPYAEANYALKTGNLAIFQWAHQRGVAWPTSEETMRSAALLGYLPILQWARVPMTLEMFRDAAMLNRMDVLRWIAVEHPDYRRDALARESVASHGNPRDVAWMDAE